LRPLFRTSNSPDCYGFLYKFCNVLLKFGRVQQVSGLGKMMLASSLTPKPPKNMQECQNNLTLFPCKIQRILQRSFNQPFKEIGLIIMDYYSSRTSRIAEARFRMPMGFSMYLRIPRAAAFFACSIVFLLSLAPSFLACLSPVPFLTFFVDYVSLLFGFFLCR